MMNENIKEPLQGVFGKTIRSVVFRSGVNVSPASQLFLVFEDRTYFEFYGQEIHFIRSLADGDVAKAIEYVSKFSPKLLVVNQE
jgi:hypothetical protein